MTYRRMLYILAIMIRNHFKMYMFGVVGETHAHDYFEVVSFYKSKDIQYNILRYIIPRILRHMCNISKTKQGNQKRNDNLLCYLSVFSNKTNLILGFSSPLTNRLHFSVCVCTVIVHR